MGSVKTYQTAEGLRAIGRTGSWAAWRSWFKSKNLPMHVDADEDGVCLRCHGEQDLNTKQFGLIRCICSIMEEEAALKIQISGWRSSHEPKSLLDLEPWGDIMAQDELITTVDYLKGWLEWPEKWVHIQGKVGSGKSHMLQALATELAPWAMYISATDLESKTFRALEDKELEDMADAIKRFPILLLDDIGTDYGSDFPKSILRKIIDFRYTIPWEYVTVTTTNLDRFLLRQYDLRISDRILDNKIGEIIRMPNVGSWRTQHNANSG